MKTVLWYVAYFISHVRTLDIPTLLWPLTPFKGVCTQRSVVVCALCLRTWFLCKDELQKEAFRKGRPRHPRMYSIVRSFWYVTQSWRHPYMWRVCDARSLEYFRKLSWNILFLRFLWSWDVDTKEMTSSNCSMQELHEWFSTSPAMGDSLLTFSELKRPINAKYDTKICPKNDCRARGTFQGNKKRSEKISAVSKKCFSNCEF